MHAKIQRRRLDFRHFAQVAEDLDRLHALGYTRSGRWDLAQICEHLAVFMEMSLTGFRFRFPWPMRVMGRSVLRQLTLWRRSIPTGFSAPRELNPRSELSHAAAIAVVKKLLCRVRDAQRFQPSPLFGRMSAEEWRQIHLIHCAHHLSFLIPKTTIPQAPEMQEQEQQEVSARG